MPRGQQTEPLQLHSYKIDTSHLQSKLEELERLKDQLQKALVAQNNREAKQSQKYQALEIQNSKLLKENLTFKQKIKENNWNISQLEEKVRQLTKQNDDLRRENILSRKQLTYVQKQKASIEKQLAAELVIQAKKSKAARGSINYANNSSIPSESEISLSSSKQEALSSNSSTGSSSKKIKRLKRNSSLTDQSRLARTSAQVKEKYRICNQISEKEQDSNLSAEDLYLEMIRLLYKQLLKIQLKARDLLKVPIVDSFYRVAHPTRNDLNKLLSNYPFQIKQQHRLSLIHEYIAREVNRKGMELSGQAIIQQIAEAVEEIQGGIQMSMHSGQSSAYLTESDILSNSLAVSSGFRRFMKPANVAEEKGLSMANNGLKQDGYPEKHRGQEYE